MTLADMLAAQARRTPDTVFLRTRQGDVTYAEADGHTDRYAAGLAGLGARHGTPVVALMRNSADAVFTWFAAARLGAVYVPVNTALVGAGLVHTFRVTRARVAVVDADLLPQLLAVIGELDLLCTVLVRGADPGALTQRPRSIRFVDFALLGRHPRPPVPDTSPTDELAPAMMLFTSGTTGPSKACVLSHRYVMRQGELHAKYLGLTGGDVLYCPFPLFHLDATTLTVVAALDAGATAAIGVRFSASGFWDEVRSFDATVFNFMGATLTILWKQPPGAADRAHRVRLAWGVPMPDWKAEWEQRFGFPLFEVYGLTDGGVVAYDPLDTPGRPGSCGRIIPEYEVAVADGDGTPLPRGHTGEILIRPREPGTVMTEYYGMPDATAEAFRGGWLHTGDLGHLDHDDYLYFHGRAKDGIRRRGENISAYEVEQIVESHPGVLEAAAIGVPSELTEEDVKICVVLRPGAQLSAEELIAYCALRSAAYMVPRFVEFLPELPKTPTQKVEKFRLKEAGVTKATWDREAVAQPQRVQP
ncbi:AMP-binding protein [Streptomyces malaysiensis]|uniref:Crotonobetaine/carnitine-CoA ligase n=1 Tax=Streptomyces malaysiensis TaxID=92644 RepID=A0A7X6B0N0_STRMQ|nr:AMP-binding protein [Streptomyces malaysiensis]NIY69278.1 crotonobetaine/carnitine-CoA ligase [Streptomyces malaysiensis]